MIPFHFRAFEVRLAENVKNTESNDESDNQRTALVGLKAFGKRGTVGSKRTGNALLGKMVEKEVANNIMGCNTH